MQFGRVASEAMHLVSAGRAAEAEALVTRTRNWSADAQLLLVMSRAKSLQADGERSVYFAQRAFEAANGDADAAFEYIRAAATWQSGKGAENAARRVIKADSRGVFTPAFFGRAAAAAMEDHRWSSAAGIARAAWERFPTDLDLMHGVGNIMLKMGDPEGALVHLRKVTSTGGATAHPGLHALHAVVTHYACENPGEVAAAHAALNASLNATLTPTAQRNTAARDPDPERVLHVGILSGDIYDHAVMRFLLGFLKCRPRDTMRVTCFSTGQWQDGVTQEVRGLADAFVAMGPRQHPDAECDRLRSAEVDVLIDLAGLLPGERAEALLRRVAPVQISMIGYPGSTGLSTMDWRVVDSLTDPAGAEPHATERLARIDPCFLCYAPRDDAPDIAQRARGGPVVFGSFNTLQKHSLRTLALWARVLEQTPGSRLLIKNLGMSDPGTRDSLVNRLKRVGVDHDRCDLIDFIPDRASHLSAYSRIDIALDTFPYHGTTTTCEAMWMGVPVVSRVGVSHASRVGLSLLSAVGLRDLACESDDAFVHTAAQLAADSARRDELRANLRSRMSASPLCDAVAHTARLSRAIRNAWKQACDGTEAGSH